MKPTISYQELRAAYDKASAAIFQLEQTIGEAEDNDRREVFRVRYQLCQTINPMLKRIENDR